MGNEQLPDVENDKQAEPVAQPSLPWGRYFVAESQEGKMRGLACFFCRKRGHLARDCQEKISGAEICFFCDERHDPTRCPLASHVCFICGSLGHRRQVCPQKDSRYDKYCFYCETSDHDTIDCKQCWRQYSLKTGAPATSIEVISCYTCGSAEHWGDDCPERFRTGFGGPTAFSKGMISWMRKQHQEVNRGVSSSNNGRTREDRGKPPPPRERERSRSRDRARDRDRDRDRQRNERDRGDRYRDRGRERSPEYGRQEGSIKYYSGDRTPPRGGGRDRDRRDSPPRRDRDTRDRGRDDRGYDDRRSAGRRDYDEGRRYNGNDSRYNSGRQRSPSPPRGRWKGGYTR